MLTRKDLEPSDFEKEFHREFAKLSPAEQAGRSLNDQATFRLIDDTLSRLAEFDALSEEEQAAQLAAIEAFNDRQDAEARAFLGSISAVNSGTEITSEGDAS